MSTFTITNNNLGVITKVGAYPNLDNTFNITSGQLPIGYQESISGTHTAIYNSQTLIPGGLIYLFSPYNDAKVTITLNGNEYSSLNYSSGFIELKTPRIASGDTIDILVEVIGDDIPPSPSGCSLINFYTDGAVDPAFEFVDCSGTTHQFLGAQGFSESFCGDLSSAIVISGDGVIEFVEVCTDPSLYNSISVDLGYDVSDAAAACSATTSTYYLRHGEILTTGTTMYTQYSVDTNFIVPDGYYSDGTDVYEVNDGTGQIISISSCTP